MITAFTYRLDGTPGIRQLAQKCLDAHRRGRDARMLAIVDKIHRGERDTVRISGAGGVTDFEKPRHFRDLHWMPGETCRGRLPALHARHNRTAAGSLHRIMW